MLFNKIKKIVFLSLLFFAVFVAPMSVRAQVVPTIDALDIVQNSISAVQNTTLTFKEFVLDPLAYMVAKTALNKLTQGVLTWAGGGIGSTDFNGNAAFVQNPDQYYGQIRSNATDKYLSGLQNNPNSICGPLQGSILPSLTQNFNTGLSPNLGDPSLEALLPTPPSGPGCSLNSDLQNKGTYDAFVGGDFSQGGWDAWYNLTQNPENNIYGASMIAEEQGNSYAEDAVAAEQNRNNIASGFRDVRDSSGNITTPGSVVANQVNNVVSSPVRQLENVHELNEVVSALVNQLITRTLSQGLSSLSSPSSGTNGSASFLSALGADNGSQSNSGNYDAILAQTNQNSQAQNAIDAANYSAGLLGGGENNSGNNTATRVNLAAGRGAYTTQKGQSGDGRPELAVDGNTSGVVQSGYGSVAITRKDTNPWWEIDLGAIDQTVGDIVIFRQTQNEGSSVGGADAVGTFRVFVYNSPSNDAGHNTLDSGTFDPVGATAGLTNYNYNSSLWASDNLTMGNSQVSLTIPVNQLGRFVRVQRVDGASSNLRLAEVQIFQNNRPVVTLDKTTPLSVIVGQTFTDPTVAKATDDEDKAGTLVIVKTYYKLNTQTAERTLVGTGDSVIDTSAPGTFLIAYTVTDSGGATAKEVTRTVNVVPPDPTVVFQITDSSNQPVGSSIASTTALTISWTTSNAPATFSCFANSTPALTAWLGSKDLSGTQSLSALSVGTYTFTITCADSNPFTTLKTTTGTKTVLVN